MPFLAFFVPWTRRPQKWVKREGPAYGFTSYSSAKIHLKFSSHGSPASDSSLSRLRHLFQERPPSSSSNSVMTRLSSDATNGEATNNRIDYSKLKPQLYNQR